MSLRVIFIFMLTALNLYGITLDSSQQSWLEALIWSSLYRESIRTLITGETLNEGALRSALFICNTTTVSAGCIRQNIYVANCSHFPPCLEKRGYEAKVSCPICAELSWIPPLRAVFKFHPSIDLIPMTQYPCSNLILKRAFDPTYLWLSLFWLAPFILLLGLLTCSGMTKWH